DVENSGIVAPRPRGGVRFGFGGGFQSAQMAGPEPVEKVAYGEQAVRPHDVQVAGALAPLGDEAGAAQDLEVERDGLLRQGDVLGDVADGPRLIADGGQDAAAVGVGERAEGGVDGIGGGEGNGHGVRWPYSSIYLYKCQRVFCSPARSRSAPRAVDVPRV